MYLPTFTKTTQISKNNKFCRLNRQPTPLSGSGNDHPGQTSHPPSVGPYSWAPHESMCPWKTSVWGRRDPWELCKCNGHINLSKQQTFATYNNINNIHISFFHAHPKATHFHISCWYQKLSIAVISYLHNSAWCFGHSESTPFQQPHHFSGVFSVNVLTAENYSRSEQLGLLTVSKKNKNDVKPPSNQRVLKMRSTVLFNKKTPKCALANHSHHPFRKENDLKQTSREWCSSR